MIGISRLILFAMLLMPIAIAAQTTADDYYRLGKAHMAEYRSNDIALRYFDKAIELDPKHSEALYSRGWIKWARMKTDAALADFTRAIESNPKVARYYLVRANATPRANVEAKLSDYAKAIEAEPAYPHTYLSRGQLLFEMRDRERSRADFTKGIEINSRQPDTHAAIFYSYRARTYLELGPADLPAAFADLNKVIELWPTMPWAYLKRSEIYTKWGDHKKAAADMMKYRELSANWNASPINSDTQPKSLRQLPY